MTDEATCRRAPALPAPEKVRLMKGRQRIGGSPGRDGKKSLPAMFNFERSRRTLFLKTASGTPLWRPTSALSMPQAEVLRGQ